MRSLTLKKLTTLAVLSAMSVGLCVLVHFPILPAFPFLEFDFGDLPVLVAGLLYGAPAGLVVTLIAALVQGLTVSASSGFWGILMHFIATGVLVTICSLIAHRNMKALFRTALALCLGILGATLVMIPLNLLVTPIYTGLPVKAVLEMILPGIVPFNLIKFSVNSLLAFALWTALCNTLFVREKTRVHE